MLGFVLPRLTVLCLGLVWRLFLLTSYRTVLYCTQTDTCTHEYLLKRTRASHFRAALIEPRIGTCDRSFFGEVPTSTVPYSILFEKRLMGRGYTKFIEGMGGRLDQWYFRGIGNTHSCPGPYFGTESRTLRYRVSYRYDIDISPGCAVYHGTHPKTGGRLSTRF